MNQMGLKNGLASLRNEQKLLWCPPIEFPVEPVGMNGDLKYFTIFWHGRKTLCAEE